MKGTFCVWGEREREKMKKSDGETKKEQKDREKKLEDNA